MLKHPKQEVKHMLTGSRYTVARSRAGSGESIPTVVLPAELKNGACAIDRWLKANPPELGGGSGAPPPMTKNSAGGCPESRVCNPKDGVATDPAVTGRKWCVRNARTQASKKARTPNTNNLL